jgi:hypothetical protein
MKYRQHSVQESEAQKHVGIEIHNIVAPPSLLHTNDFWTMEANVKCKGIPVTGREDP